MVLTSYTLTLELIQEFLMMTGKRHTSKLTIKALPNYCKKFCSGISVLCHNRNHSLVEVHVYRAYIIILGLQFLSLGTLEPSSRDRQEKMAIKFYASQNTP